ncbi:MAG: DUF1318 domain-containing protein [Proteobacteria bacterium]|nr:MAG: DUF1318 domain-containing protein [Pseudomonadota bacterium]
MQTLRSWIALGFVLAALGLAGAASALDLDGAKAQGLVGETTDGYVAAVEASPSEEVERLVDDVNGRRRASYEAIAKKNGTPTATVAKLAAEKLLHKAPSGAWIRDGGRWYQKK